MRKPKNQLTLHIYLYKDEPLAYERVAKFGLFLYIWFSAKRSDLKVFKGKLHCCSLNRIASLKLDCLKTFSHFRRSKKNIYVLMRFKTEYFVLRTLKERKRLLKVSL